MATYRRAEDLINIGAYVAGSNPKIDYAITMIDTLRNRYSKYLEQCRIELFESVCGYVRYRKCYRLEKLTEHIFV